MRLASAPGSALPGRLISAPQPKARKWLVRRIPQRGKGSSIGPRRDKRLLALAGVSLSTLAAVLVLRAAPAGAADVRLAWLPLSAAAGYRIYTRAARQQYEQGTDVGNRPADPDGIVRGVVQGVDLDVATYFAVTSYDADGIETPFSNELALRPPLLCAAAPTAGCRGPSEPAGAVLSLRNPDGVKRDRLGWKWKRGADVNIEDVGDPTAETSYVLCVYDDSGGTSHLAISLPVPAGGTCGGGRPCWRPLGNRGFSHANRLPAGGGFIRVKLRHGTGGKGGIAVSARGENLAFPDPPSPLLEQDPLVTVQLVNDTEQAACWEAVYGGAAQVSAPTRFKDSSD